MIPSTTYSTPSLPTHEFPKRPLSANFSSPPPTSLAQRRRNNKNLSLCLLPWDNRSPVPPSTPFLSTTSFSSSSSFASSSHPKLQPVQRQYYQQGPIAVLPGLYLGNEQNANNAQQLKNLSIHGMINVAAEVTHPHAQVFQYWDHLLDNNNNNIASTTTTTAPCPTLSTSSSSTNSTNSTFTLPSPLTTPTSTESQAFFSTMGYKKRAWHHHILDDDQSIQKELDAAVMDVVRMRQSGRNVLVHCQCGLARSATVVVAYVMYTLRLSMSAAMLHVKKYAPHINPNLSLMYQLREYELGLASSPRRPVDGSGGGGKAKKNSNVDTIMIDTTPLSPTSSKALPPTPSSLKKQPSSSSLAAKWKSFKTKSSSTTSSLRPGHWWRSSTSSSSLQTAVATPLTSAFPSSSRKK
ncbi:unnamed protein product [Absidia cylindrospora]